MATNQSKSTATSPQTLSFSQPKLPADTLDPSQPNSTSATDTPPIENGVGPPSSASKTPTKRARSRSSPAPPPPPSLPISAASTITTPTPKSTASTKFGTQLQRKGAAPPPRLDTSAAVTGGVFPGIIISAPNVSNSSLASSSSAGSNERPRSGSPYSSSPYSASPYSSSPQSPRGDYRTIRKTNSFFVPESHYASPISSAPSSAGPLSASAPGSIRTSMVTMMSPRSVGFMPLAPFPSPGAITFAQFRKEDLHPRRQRQILFALQQQERKKTVNEDKKKDHREGRSKKSDTNLKRDRSQKRNAAFSKLNSFLKSAKKKRRTTSGTFHLLNLAIHDSKTSLACALMDDLSPNTLRKKRVAEANRVFLLGMASSMEPLCMLMLERGFPVNVNSAALSCKDFSFPSYFLMAVALGLDNVVRLMIKRANLNQSWYGLTALHLACCKGNFNLVQILVEHGADLGQGLPLSEYMLLRRLQSQNSKSVFRLIAKSNPILLRTKRQSIVFSLETRDGASASSKESDGRVYGSLTSGIGRRRTITQPTSKEERRRIPDSYLQNKRILPIEFAAACGHGDIVMLLLQRTALHEAISQHHFNVAKSLLSLGADPTILNATGESPIALARRIGVPESEIADILLRKPVEAAEQPGQFVTGDPVGSLPGTPTSIQEFSFPPRGSTESSSSSNSNGCSGTNTIGRSSSGGGNAAPPGRRRKTTVGERFAGGHSSFLSILSRDRSNSQGSNTSGNSIHSHDLPLSSEAAAAAAAAASIIEQHQNQINGLSNASSMTVAQSQPSIQITPEPSETTSAVSGSAKASSASLATKLLSASKSDKAAEKGEKADKGEKSAKEKSVGGLLRGRFGGKGKDQGASKEVAG
ncbi:hypothetical protein HK102_009196 [Quaeritorhiza haematococci]|nr:hypothetical protein HK102_009196 [Quaeritorhiza haematococci]